LDIFDLSETNRSLTMKRLMERTREEKFSPILMSRCLALIPTEENWTIFLSKDAPHFLLIREGTRAIMTKFCYHYHMLSLKSYANVAHRCAAHKKFPLNQKVEKRANCYLKALAGGGRCFMPLEGYVKPFKRGQIWVNPLEIQTIEKIKLPFSSGCEIILGDGFSLQISAEKRAEWAKLSHALVLFANHRNNIWTHYFGENHGMNPFYEGMTYSLEVKNFINRLLKKYSSSELLLPYGCFEQQKLRFYQEHEVF
jgi:hypothetical protein